MKTTAGILLVIVVVISSCQWGVPHSSKPAVTKDTLVYTYQNIEEKAPDCGSKPDTDCTSAKITYPVFKSQSALNDTITRRLLTVNSISEKPDTDLHQQAKSFINAYLDDISPKKNSDLVYSLESNATVVRQDSSLVTVQIDRYLYAGGAHGSNYTGFINWNTKENKKISLNDLFVTGYDTKLTSVAEKIFRRDEKLSDTSSLTGYFFKGAKFKLNNNFLITPVGLRFLYNEYEIKPYSGGSTELLIPYTQIKSLLRPHTVISQYNK
jgi:hypothetical protein